MAKVVRSLRLVNATGQSRIETYQGKDYVVVPVVALVEGVIWPVNAETPEYVPLSSFSEAPECWNGRPVFPGHPMRDGEYVLGNDPDLWETLSIGQIFNAGVANDKLAMEAWLDKAKAEEMGGDPLDIVTRAEANEMVEVSVGAVVVVEEEVTGEYKGQRYSGMWVRVYQDHLALLPRNEVGACSVGMGCGTRVAKAHLVTAKGFELVERKEAELPAPSANKNKGDKKEAKQGFFSVLKGFLRNASPAGYSDTEVRGELLEALTQKEANFKWSGFVVDVYDNEGIVVYTMYDGDDYDLYTRTYKWTGDVPVLSDDRVEVEAVTYYEPVDPAEELAEQLLNASGFKDRIKKTTAATNAAPCGCQDNKGEDRMNRQERIAALITATKGKPNAYTDADSKWLEAVPEDRFKALEESATKVEPREADKPPVKPAEPEPQGGAKPTDNKPTEQPKQATQETEEEYLAKAPKSIQQMVARQKQVDAGRRSFLVGKLKTAQTEYKEDELVAMELDQLERMGRMCGVQAIHEVDFSPAAPRAGSSNQNDRSGLAPAATNMNDRVRAAAGSKK